MTKPADFHREIPRRGTGCVKYDALLANYGRDDLEPLWVADMDFASPEAVTEALRRRVDHPVYGYAVTPDSFYQEIARWLHRRHGFDVGPQEICYVPGVVRGIALALMHFTSAGDTVVIQPPVYHPFRRLVEGNGRRCVTNPLVLTEDAAGNPRYEMDLDGLERVVAAERPRMLILCNPHNPSGRQWDADTLRRVAQICRRAGVVVVSDEIHGDLMNDGRRHIPFATVSDDAAAVAVTFGAPSKTFNIPGLVSSWVVVPNRALREPFYQWLEVNEFSSPTFLAADGAEAAYAHGEEWLDAVLQYIGENIAAVEQAFAERLPQVKVMHPDASYLIWIDFRALGFDQAELNRRMVDVAGVALNPGDMFGTEGTGFMRLNAGMPRRRLLDAVGRIIDACR